ncbi:two-component response regulator 24-like [Gastrolobium bilobum]|uniref:two-component response regulator 24-like n=1 Tax=Gastrolobium bilobum TaxID=150636 RepID=UPI002AB18858|nr:two-component response regulator 24-like [Gastrolobium bilobum]
MESRQLTALVVDDDMMVRIIHRKMLNSVGVENEVVENGKEALDIHRSGQNFDLILMDMDMPIMNGIEATKKLRSMGIHSMIAGVSTRSVEAQVREFMEAGLDDYLEKPLTIAKLTSIIHKINSI